MQFTAHAVSLQTPFHFKCNTDNHVKTSHSENSSAYNKSCRLLVFGGSRPDLHLEIPENVNGNLTEQLQGK